MVGARFARDETGATMIEATLVITLLLTLVLGFVDFGHAFYQWNAANKAVQAGARLAAVSSPVAVASILSAATTNDLTLIGQPMASGSFSFTCTSTSCTSGSAFDAAAFNRIATRMEQFFPGIDRTGIRITYAATGLGYWSRPGGAVPTIRVSIENQPFEFFFLGGLLGFANITMPNMLSTITGEDLSTTY